MLLDPRNIWGNKWVELISSVLKQNVESEQHVSWLYILFSVYYQYFTTSSFPGPNIQLVMCLYKEIKLSNEIGQLPVMCLNRLVTCPLRAPNNNNSNLYNYTYDHNSHPPLRITPPPT